MKTNQMIVGDVMYSLDKAYRSGALAMRNQVPNRNNPFRHGTQKHDQWDYGHVNESVGEHLRFDVDLISAPQTGHRFEEDQNVPRDENHEVDRGWYQKKLAGHK